MEEYFVEEKTTFDKVMEFLVFVSVFIVTVFFIAELLGSSGNVGIDLERLAVLYFPFDIVVFIVFFVDLIRLYLKADGVKEFLLDSWLDILATIPFGLMFGFISPSNQVLKLTRYGKLSAIMRTSKLSRATKIGRQFKAASHLKKESEDYKKKHRL